MSIPALRVFDGFRWRHLPPTPGAWQALASIQRTDRAKLSFQAVARDAQGNSAQAPRALTVDSLALLPTTSASLPANTWHTDQSPTLAIRWLTPFDRSGVSGLWADIDHDPAGTARVDNLLQAVQSGTQPVEQSAPKARNGSARPSETSGSSHRQRAA